MNNLSSEAAVNSDHPERVFEAINGLQQAIERLLLGVRTKDADLILNAVTNVQSRTRYTMGVAMNYRNAIEATTP